MVKREEVEEEGDLELEFPFDSERAGTRFEADE